MELFDALRCDWTGIYKHTMADITLVDGEVTSVEVSGKTYGPVKIQRTELGRFLERARKIRYQLPAVRPAKAHAVVEKDGSNWLYILSEGGGGFWISGPEGESLAPGAETLCREGSWTCHEDGTITSPESDVRIDLRYGKVYANGRVYFLRTPNNFSDIWRLR